MVDKVVHISTTVHAIAKLFTPMCSPRGGDHQKNTGLLIGTHFVNSSILTKHKWTMEIACHTAVDSLGISSYDVTMLSYLQFPLLTPHEETHNRMREYCDTPRL